MNRAKGSRGEILAVDLDEAGLGVGPGEAGLRIHVPGLLPGERAEVVVDHVSPHKADAWGHMLRQIGRPSPDRTTPACPAFGRCGGCTWQHLDYGAQLTAKRRRVELALADILAIDQRGVSVAPVRPSPRETGYRNKGKYVVGRAQSTAGDTIVLGAYAPRSHHVIDTLGCKIVAPVIDEVAVWVRGAAEAASLVPYSEQSRTGELRYVVVRESAGDVIVALVVAPGTSREKLDQVASALARHPAVRGVVMLENDRRDGAILPSGAVAKVLHGSGQLVEHLAGVPVEVGAGEFVQVNREQAHAMYERVAELAEVTTETRAVDLFAGLGGIGLHLARAGAEVVALEIDREAVAQLARAAETAGLPLTAIAADASGVSSAVRTQLGAAPDVVVVNPPRKGLGAGALDLVIDLAPRTLIYVSCGPESLGKDLVVLSAHGWMPDAIEPFDLMPGTAQIETVVRLRRG